MTIGEHRLNRREALMGTGLVGAGALAAMLSGCTGTSANAAGSSSSTLEGAWLQEVTFDDGSPSVQSLTLYTSDGGVVMASTLAPGLFSPGLGAWKSIGNNQYQITFELFGFDASGNVAGVWRARSLATIDHAKDQMSARSSLEFQASGGGSFSSRGTQQITGSRIKPLAL